MAYTGKRSLCVLVGVSVRTTCLRLGGLRVVVDNLPVSCCLVFKIYVYHMDDHLQAGTLLFLQRQEVDFGTLRWKMWLIKTWMKKFRNDDLLYLTL